jgi:hypothetical protein
VNLDGLKARCSVDPETGCWKWAGYVKESGYAQVTVSGVRWYVHRLAVALDGRPATAEQEVDHLCKVRHCCNPAHLEVVTRLENLRRSNGIAQQNARTTHCSAGHPLSPGNLRKAPGRDCKTCHRERRRLWLADPENRKKHAENERARRAAKKGA